MRQGDSIRRKDSGARPVSDSRGAAFPRFLLYSHDSWGLGHLRRNLTIATALTETFEGANTLVVTGSPCATHFSHPPGISIVKLPSVTKDESGEYRPRSLDGGLSSILTLRSALLREAFRIFDPHLVIIDHQVIGLHGEALPVLEEARRRGAKTVLGVRDIVDSPAAVERQWANSPCQWALGSAYDRICSYGDARVFDPRVEYASLAKVAGKVELTGYVVRSQPPDPEASARRDGGVLVTMGGGQDGVERVHTYLDCLALGRAGWGSTIVTGPLMTGEDFREIRRRARTLGGVKVHRFHPDMPHLLERAQVVVSMAGYNSSAEILQSGTPAILLPRTFPRREQSIRATRLARLGLVHVLLSPEPEQLRRRIERVVAQKRHRGRSLKMDGAQRMCDIADRLLGMPRYEGERRSAGWHHASHTY